MAFDDALRLQHQNPERTREDLLQGILDELDHHPFAQMDPVRAREVGEFRLRLHGV